MGYFPKRFAKLLDGVPDLQPETRQRLAARLAEVEADIIDGEAARDRAVVACGGPDHDARYAELVQVVEGLTKLRDEKDALDAGLRRVAELEAAAAAKAARAARRQAVAAINAHAMNATNAATALTAAIESGVKAWRALCQSRAAMLAAIPPDAVVPEGLGLLHVAALDRAVQLEIARLGAVVPHVTGQPPSEAAPFPGARAPLSHLHMPDKLKSLADTLASADRALREALLSPAEEAAQ